MSLKPAAAQILFWGNKSTLPHENILAKCAPLWERLKNDMPFEAIDPLMHLWNAGAWRDIKHPGKVLRDIAMDIPDAVISLLEFGLVNRSRLVTIFERLATFQEKERTLFVIRLLGEVGTSKSIKFLEPLTETSDYGQAAIEAIRLIKKRDE